MFARPSGGPIGACARHRRQPESLEQSLQPSAPQVQEPRGPLKRPHRFTQRIVIGPLLLPPRGGLKPYFRTHQYSRSALSPLLRPAEDPRDAPPSARAVLLELLEGTMHVPRAIHLGRAGACTSRGLPPPPSPPLQPSRVSCDQHQRLPQSCLWRGRPKGRGISPTLFRRGVQPL
jgi:hypothetical protein